MSSISSSQGFRIKWTDVIRFLLRLSRVQGSRIQGGGVCILIMQTLTSLRNRFKQRGCGYPTKKKIHSDLCCCASDTTPDWSCNEAEKHISMGLNRIHVCMHCSGGSTSGYVTRYTVHIYNCLPSLAPSCSARVTLSGTCALEHSKFELGAMHRNRPRHSIAS